MNQRQDLANPNQVFPHLAKRLSDLGNVLDKASISESGEDNNSIEVLEAEIVGDCIPDKAFAELAKPLYEKVVCNIPFLLIDEKTMKLATKKNLLCRIR